MLQYELADKTDGVQVTFIRRAGVGQVIAAFVFVVLVSWTWSHLRMVLYSNSPNLLFGDMFLFEFGGFASVLAGSVLVAMVVRTQAVFSKSGILLRKTFFGIPLKSSWYAEYEISGFGPTYATHSRSIALGFRASNSSKLLHGGVSMNEVNSFISMLRAKGIEYSAESEPRHIVNRANGFLRQ